MAKNSVSKKGAAKQSTKQLAVETPAVTEAQAIAQLAEAIKALADAIVSQKAVTPSGAPETAFSATAKLPISDVFDKALLAGPSPDRLPPLTAEQILDGVRSIFNQPRLKLDDDLNALIPGGAAILVSMWRDINGYKPFQDRQLWLGPNDLRFVSSVSDLVGVIAWGLKNALRR